MGCSLLTVDARPARSPTLGAGRASRSTLPRWGVLMLKLTRALYRNAEQRFDYELADRHPRVKRERSLGVAHHLQRDVALEARVNSWRREMHNDPEPRQRTTALHARGQDWFTVRPIVEVVRQTQCTRSAVWPRMNFPGSSFHPCRGSISSGVVSAARALLTPCPVRRSAVRGTPASGTCSRGLSVRSTEQVLYGDSWPPGASNRGSGSGVIASRPSSSASKIAALLRITATIS